MIRDSRYEIEPWKIAHVAHEDLVGFVFPLQYYPWFETFNSVEGMTVDQVQRDGPLSYVLNADCARAEPPERRSAASLPALQAVLATPSRVCFPTPRLRLRRAHRDMVGPRREDLIRSARRHINPRFEVFKRGS